MEYTVNEIFEAMLSKISKELSEANQNGTLSEFIKKYDLFEENDDVGYYNDYNSKVLIVGELSFPIDVLYTIAKKEFNIERDRIRILNYQEAKHFDFQSLKGYSEYSDIIVGPNAHKAVGIGDYNSIVSMIQAEQNKYPLLTLATDAKGKLKFSKTSFRNAMNRTRIIQILTS